MPKKQLKKFDINEEKFRVLTETSPDCIKLFDIKGNLLYINPGGLKEHGLKNLDEALGRNWQAVETLIEEDKSKFKKALKDAAKGKISTIEIRHTKEGADREACLETIAPVRDDSGGIIGIFGVSRDITDIKKIERDLKEKEEKYRVLVETSPNCVKLFDMKGNLKYINSGGLKEHKLKSLKEALRKNWRAEDTLIKEDKPRFLKVLKDAARGKTGRVEVRHTKEGSVREVCLETIVPVKDAEGKVAAIFGVSQDITEIKRTRKILEKKVKERTNELVKEKEKLREVARFPAENPDPVFRVTTKGELLYSNKPASAMLKDWSPARKESLPSDFFALIKNAVKAKKINEVEYERIGRVYLFTLSFIKKSGYINIYGMDVTDKREAERKLKEKVEELEKINRLMVGRELKMIELKEKLKISDDAEKKPEK